MSGETDFLADTNTLLYIFQKDPCIAPYVKKLFGVSIITEIEALCYKNLSTEEEKKIRILLNDCQLFGLDNLVKEEAIRVRKIYGNKLPDAIIAATARVNLTLLTADKGFTKS